MLDRFDREPAGSGLFVAEREFIESLEDVRRYLEPSRRRAEPWISNAVIVELLRFWLAVRRERVYDGGTANEQRRQVIARLRIEGQNEAADDVRDRVGAFERPALVPYRSSVAEAWKSPLELRIRRASMPLGRRAQLYSDYQKFAKELGDYFRIDSAGEFVDRTDETRKKRERKVSDWRRDRQARLSTSDSS